MKAGLELEALILEKVFGHPRKKVFLLYEGGSYQYYIPSGKPRRTHEIDAKPVPWFSQNMGAAWMIVEKIHSGITNVAGDGLRNDLNFLTLSVLSRYGAAAASFDLILDDDWFEDIGALQFAARGETAAHAICLAALKVFS